MIRSRSLFQAIPLFTLCTLTVVTAYSRPLALESDLKDLSLPQLLDLLEKAPRVESVPCQWDKEGWALTGTKRATHLEAILTEIVRRGGPEAEKAIRAKIDANRAAETAIWKGHGSVQDAMALQRNLELMTALRRLQGKLDPLEIIAYLQDHNQATIAKLPVITVTVRSADTDALPIWMQEGAGIISSRRWRIEVRDATGNVLPLVRQDEFVDADDVTTIGLRLFGFTQEADLRLEKFVKLSRPGDYQVTVLYHDDLRIADMADRARLDELIVFRSKPLLLHVGK